VQVVVEAATHATTKLATVPADASGSFAITVTIPGIASPADISAGCVGTSPTSWYQLDIGLQLPAPKSR
jgi:hypothetical protein